MGDSDNLARLKSAYHVWNETKGDSVDKWMDLLGDDIRIRSMHEETTGLAFAKDRHTKSEALLYLTGILADWEMIHWTPEDFLEDGDKIAIFGICAWTNKHTGKSVETRIANMWKFENGKVVEITEIFDSAPAAAAAGS